MSDSQTDSKGLRQAPLAALLHVEEEKGSGIQERRTTACLLSLGAFPSSCGPPSPFLLCDYSVLGYSPVCLFSQILLVVTENQLKVALTNEGIY